MSEPSRIRVRHARGERLSGFVIRRAEPLLELGAVAYHAVHEATGAGVVHLHVDDDENLFSATFATPSRDSTGAAHIIEHSVLAGSERYPVRDAFNELSKGSLATFLNAFTAPDFTSYPTCSRLSEDFYNLASVYTDVVFHPRLTPETFRQEGHHRRIEEDGRLGASGVVFNEMKGSYSSAERVAEAATLQRLMPDTCYGFESGGHPEHILDLTYEDFVAFHRSCYTADNARFFLYGDRPTAELLAFLGPRIERAPRGEPPQAVREQRRWTSPRTTREVFPADGAGSLERRSIVNVAWLTASISDLDERLAMEILSRALVGSAASPLRRALVDSSLGEDLSPLAGLVTWYPELPFATGLRGTDPEHADVIETLVLETLRTCAERGLDTELLEAAFQEVELGHREMRRTTYPHSILLMTRAMGLWARGHDPIEPLATAARLDALRARWRRDEAFFTDRLSRHLVANPHRLLSVMTPDAGAAEAREARIRGRLARERASMRPLDLDRVRRESEELLAAQRTPDPPEVLASLPRIGPEDVPREVMTVPTAERTNGIPHLEHSLPTNGVVYVALAFDVSHLPEELQPYVTLLGEALTGMGAAGLDYGRMATRTARVTGGVEAVVSAWDRLDGGVEQRLLVRSKALARNGEAMIAVLEDILTSGDLDDTDRLSDVLVARRNRLRANVAPQGHLFSWRSAAAGLSLSRRRDEIWQGGAHLRLLSGITSRLREDAESVVAALRRVRETILTGAATIASMAGDERDLAGLRPALDRAVSGLAECPAGIRDHGPDARGAGFDPIAFGTRRSAIALPGDVCYVSRVIPVSRADHPVAGALHVLAHYLRANILYKRIRVEGGAYGGMAHYDDTAGHLVFMSYRDPNLERTLEIYDACLDELGAHPLDDETVRRTVIGALGRMERPLSPEQRSQRALRWHLGGPTEAARRALKAAVLEVDAAAMRRVAEEVVRPALERARESVYAPRARLEAANARLDPPFTIEGLDA